MDRTARRLLLAITAVAAFLAIPSLARADDLVPGAVVQEAQLYISGGQAIWKELELRR